MEFRNLAEYLEKLEETSSRIEITKILSDLFKKSKEEEIDKIVYLLLGRLAPKFDSIVFNLADRMMLQVLSKAYGKDIKQVSDLYKEKGDLGLVAYEYARKKGKDLSVEDVFDKLVVIAKEEGKDSVERKIKMTADLISNLDPLSAKFVSRIPVGKLRLGFSDRTIIDALSWMEKGDKSLSSQIKKAYDVVPDVGALAKSIKKSGLKGVLEEKTPVIGIPISPMLAQRLKSVNEMVSKMGEVSVEPKYDGLRLLIHYRKKPFFIKAFTRNLKPIDEKVFPELLIVGDQIDANEAIIDTEGVGMDEKRQRIVDFQKTIQRRRKHEVKETSEKIPFQFQVFDILEKNGKSFLDKPYIERRKELEKTIKSGKLLKVDEYEITKDPKRIRELHDMYIKKGLEGVIVKRASGKYVSGRTGWLWVKMKESEGKYSKLADTIDGVVIGYMKGKGKRASFGIGKILVGIKDGEKIKTLTKLGTGFSEEMLRETKKLLDKIKIDSPSKEVEYDKDLMPDVWVEPKVVVEVAADSISKSSKHSLGYSLRFPKFIRYRDDKSPDEATTLKEIKDLYKLQ